MYPRSSTHWSRKTQRKPYQTSTSQLNHWKPVINWKLKVEREKGHILGNQDRNNCRRLIRNNAN
jgi:hypothetical protein